jgi:hypothetical protein
MIDVATSGMKWYENALVKVIANHMKSPI